jgi:Mrp family chromosome partitioning ATPase
MSKIYEALRRHDQKPVLDDSSLPHTPLTDNFFVATRQMQTLFRSVESVLSGVQGGAMIMFSSAHPGEGKTTVCGSFAATLAQHCGKSVLILDGDRDHALARHWGHHREEVTLATLEKQPQAILRFGKRFGTSGSISAVPVGSWPGSPNGSSPEVAGVAALKDTLAKTFDYVLIDAPAVADLSWAPAIGATTDGVILIVQAERTRWPVALNSKKEFEGSGAKVLGVFLNKRRFYIPARIYRNV